MWKTQKSNRADFSNSKGILLVSMPDHFGIFTLLSKQWLLSSGILLIPSSCLVSQTTSLFTTDSSSNFTSRHLAPDLVPPSHLSPLEKPVWLTWVLMPHGISPSCTIHKKFNISKTNSNIVKPNPYPLVLYLKLKAQPEFIESPQPPSPSSLIFSHQKIHE